MATPRITNVSRSFWSKVRQGTDSECWAWAGNVAESTGLPRMSVNGRTVQAARVSYELTYGPIPARHWVHQRCRNRLCVRPDHLYIAPAAHLKSRERAA